MIEKDPRVVNPKAVTDYHRRHQYCEYVLRSGLKCGSPYAEVHHIKFRSAGGDDAEYQDGQKQLETLCRRHHEVRHGVRPRE